MAQHAIKLLSITAHPVYTAGTTFTPFYHQATYKEKNQTPTHQLNKFIHPSRGTRLTGGVTLHSTARLLQQWSSAGAPPTPETICCSEKMSKTCMPQKIHSRPVQLIFVCRSDCNTRKSFLLVSSCTIRSFAHRYILGSRRFLSRC